ncbi:hypothetical protein [Chitinophaga sp.]|uniref:hypothetical protein n=1 Tax=Chitinophaga sp. TaxID=1869181 RepID=UPI0031D3621D
MAERNIVGTYALSIKSGATFVLLVCETDDTFDRSRDSIDAASKCDPGKKVPNPTITYEVTGSAQVLLSDGEGFTTKASEAEVDALFRNMTVFDWKLGPLSGNPVPGDVTYSGSGFFSKLSTSYPTAEVAKFDFTITGTGSYTQTIEPEA